MATLNQLTQLHYFLSKSPISRTRFTSSSHSCPSTPPQHPLSVQIPHLSLCLKPQWPEDMDWTGYGPFDKGDDSSPEMDDEDVPFEHVNKSNKANQEHRVETIDYEDEEDTNSKNLEGSIDGEEEENNCNDSDQLSTPHRKRKRTSSHSNDPFSSSAFIMVPRGWKSEDEDEGDGISTNGSCALYEADDEACSVSSSSSSEEEFMIATSWERNGMPSKRAKTRDFGPPFQTDADETPELDYETMTGDEDEDEDGMSGGEDPVYRTLLNGDFIGAGSGSPRLNLITRRSNHCGDRVANSRTPRVLKVWGWIAPTVRRRGGHRAVERAQQSSKASKARTARVMDIKRHNAKQDNEDNGDAWAWGHCVKCKRVERAGIWCVCRSNSTAKEGEFGDDGVVFVSQESDYESDGEECIEISVDDMDSCSLAGEFEGSAADHVPPCDEELEHDAEEDLDQEERPGASGLEEPLSEASAFPSTCSLAPSPPPYDSAGDLEEEGDNDEEFKNQKYEEVDDNDEDGKGDTEEGKVLPVRLSQASGSSGIWNGSAEISSVRAEDWMEVDYIL